jgi:hypothetical protein
MWIEGNGLIDADLTYINSERIKIKASVLAKINQKYKDLTKPVSPESFKEAMLTPSLLNSLTGSFSLNILKENLPETGSFFLKETEKTDAKALKENKFSINFSVDSETFLKLLSKDSKEYINSLERNNLHLRLGE